MKCTNESGGNYVTVCCSELKEVFGGLGAACGGDNVRPFASKQTSSWIRATLVALVAIVGFSLVVVGVVCIIVAALSTGLCSPALVGVCAATSLVTGVVLVSWSLNYGIKMKSKIPGSEPSSIASSSRSSLAPFEGVPRSEEVEAEELEEGVEVIEELVLRDEINPFD